MKAPRISHFLLSTLVLRHASACVYPKLMQDNGGLQPATQIAKMIKVDQ